MTDASAAAAAAYRSIITKDTVEKDVSRPRLGRPPKPKTDGEKPGPNDYGQRMCWFVPVSGPAVSFMANNRLSEWGIVETSSVFTPNRLDEVEQRPFLVIQTERYRVYADGTSTSAPNETLKQVTGLSLPGTVLVIERVPGA